MEKVSKAFKNNIFFFHTKNEQIQSYLDNQTLQKILILASNIEKPVYVNVTVCN